jgi:hypothetical protein
MLKLFVHGFWEGFIENTDPNKLSVFIQLLSLAFNQDIQLGDINNSDILLESVFSETSMLHRKKWKYSIFFNGEPKKYLLDKGYKRFRYISEYDCILSGRETNSEIRIVNFPLFILYIHSNKYIPSLLNQVKITCVPPKNICAIISNGSPGLKRNIFLERLEKEIYIDYAGKYKNNVPRIDGAYNSENMLQFMSQYKFVITMENTKQETYITEKIINGFLANTIPVYWGSNKISNYFNEERFINIPTMTDRDINEAIYKIKDIINDTSKYLTIVNQPIFNNNILFRTLEDISIDMKSILQV